MLQKNKAGRLLVMIEIDPAYEDEFNRWYLEEHFPDRMACPGFVRGRRFVALEGEPKYLALFDLESPEVLNTDEYGQASIETERWGRLMPHFAKLVRNIYVEIEP